MFDMSNGSRNERARQEDRRIEALAPRPIRIDAENDRAPQVPDRRRQRRHLVEQLLTISKSTRSLAGLHLARIGLEIGQDHFLATLAGVGIASTSKLSDLMGVRPSTVSKMADRLVRKGLIERSSDERDARRALLQLTDDGRSKCDEVRASWNRMEASLARCDPIGDEAISQTLDTVDRALRTQLSGLR